MSQRKPPKTPSNRRMYCTTYNGGQTLGRLYKRLHDAVSPGAEVVVFELVEVARIQCPPSGHKGMVHLRGKAKEADLVG